MVSKQCTLTIKMSESLYRQLNDILFKEGLTIEKALLLFLKETVKQGKIPFDYTDEDIEKAKDNCGIEVICND